MASASDDAPALKKMEERVEKDDQYRRELMLLFKDLRSMAVSGMEFFKEEKGPNNDRFYSAFDELYEHLERGIEPAIDYLIRIAHLYDFDAATEGNGYRSLITIVHKCTIHILQLCRYIAMNKESFLFRGGHYSRELQEYVTMLGQLRACLFYLQKLSSYTQQGELTPDEEALSKEDYATAKRLMIEVENLDQEAFYGRCLAFQYCQSMQKPLTTVNLVMASFSEGYTQSSTVMKLANSIIGGSKYMMDPDLRAKRVVNVTRNGDINFCKSFWQMNESPLMHNLPLFICPPVRLDKVIILPADPFDVPLLSGGSANITVPSVHTGPAPVHTRLISYELREGQEQWRAPSSSEASNGKPLSPKSHALLIHIHGGGFVAQSSASHEVYLRHWAKELNVPVFSVDYSLAPENPFPRQIEEAFFAYCWALKNCQSLGSTGERICIAGDSAGGNLAVAIAIRAKECGIRQPDGVLSTYGSLLVKYAPSPSRILALMDPLLPIGILSKCLAAYAGIHVEGGLKLPAPCSDSVFGSAFLPDCDTAEGSPDSGCCMEQAAVGHQSNPSNDSGFDSEDKDRGDDRVSQFVQQLKDGAHDVDFSLHGRPLKHSPSQPVFSTFHRPTSNPDVYGSPHQFAKIADDNTSPMALFHNMPLASNPYLSPLLASDEQLNGLCPIYLVACQLDPILDDSVMFARRLRSVHQPVHLDILPDLPHGFLNFVLISPEAKKASELCVSRMLEVFEVDDISLLSSEEGHESWEGVHGDPEELLR